ncbi:MAG: hypothetical protein IKE48_03700, partial [Parasporobacterium sp.]|nr:hypothetical protein [Parasporobacterium sp.]
VVDIAFNGANVAKAFGAIDYTKVLYRFETDLSTHIKTCCINLDVYNSFNDELKAIWDEETGDKMYEDFRAFVDKSEQEQWAGFDENPNLDVRMITNDQIAAWKEAIMPFADAQLEELRTDHPDLDAARKIWEDSIANYYASN